MPAGAMQNTTRHVRWIDAVRAFAAAAVVVDHFFGVLYASEDVIMTTRFSISAFIILAGYTNALYMQKHSGEPLPKLLFSRVLKLIAPYALATAVCQLVSAHFFKLDVFTDNFLHFSACSPYYFLLVYIQLTLVGPIIWMLFRKAYESRRCAVYFALLLALIGAAAWFFTKRTDMLPVFGAGRVMFGGSLLLFYAFGTAAAFFPFEIRKKSTAAVLFACGLAAAVGLWLFIRADRLNFDASVTQGWSFSPPGFTLFFYALAVILTLRGALALLLPTRAGDALCRALEFVGRRSLDIFLYFEPCKQLFYQLTGVGLGSPLALRLLALLFALLFPCVCRVLWQKAKAYVLSANIKRTEG